MDQGMMNMMVCRQKKNMMVHHMVTVYPEVLNVDFAAVGKEKRRDTTIRRC